MSFASVASTRAYPGAYVERDEVIDQFKLVQGSDVWFNYEAACEWLDDFTVVKYQ